MRPFSWPRSARADQRWHRTGKAVPAQSVMPVQAPALGMPLHSRLSRAVRWAGVSPEPGDVLTLAGRLAFFWAGFLALPPWGLASCCWGAAPLAAALCPGDSGCAVSGKLSAKPDSSTAARMLSLTARGRLLPHPAGLRRACENARWPKLLNPGPCSAPSKMDGWGCQGRRGFCRHKRGKPRCEQDQSAAVQSSSMCRPASRAIRNRA